MLRIRKNPHEVVGKVKPFTEWLLVYFTSRLPIENADSSGPTKNVFSRAADDDSPPVGESAQFSCGSLSRCSINRRQERILIPLSRI